jgi:hypothetical protein
MTIRKNLILSIDRKKEQKEERQEERKKEKKLMQIKTSFSLYTCLHLI